MLNGVRVLHVEDNPEFADLTATSLEREDDTLSVVTETRVEDALTRFRNESIDCIVSDYDMPTMDGLELLTEVRAKDPDFPFILFTGKGSEEIAAEAISNGVTDYLQKQGGLDQYTILANRIKNGIERHRATKEAAQSRRFLNKIVKRATDMISVVSEDGDVTFVSGSVERILGYTPDEIEELGPFAIIHEDHQERVMEQFDRRLSDADAPTDIHFCAVHKNGQTVECRARAYNLVDDSDINGVLIYTRKDGPETGTRN
jgi:PAS domain S-box-containing protein